MKKTLTLVAAFVMAATMAKAESELSSVQSEILAKEEMNISDVATDMSMLESKRALFATPQQTSEKNVSYYAQSVLSRVKVLAYAQAGYTAAFNEDAPNTNTFDMKRAVLMVGAEITKDFYAFFMHEFKSGSLQEYYMEYRPCKAINFRLGQSKTELSIENPMSPRVLESIGGTSQSVSWLCGADPLIGNPAGRDMGLMMYGDLFNNHLRYVVEVLNGGKVNTNDQNNQKNVIAKLEYKPVKNMRFSVSGQKGYGYAVTNSIYNPSVSVGETYRQDRYAVGAEWLSSPTGNDYYKNRCATVRAEALGGRDGDCHSFGAYCAATVPVYKGMDIVAQADYFNRNTDLKLKQTNLLLGVQYWMHTKCRVQAQYQYSMLSDEMKVVKGAGNCSQLLAQIQFSF